MNRADIYTLVQDITPLDNLESEHIRDTLSWIESDAPLFRIQKPDVPPKHLVSYFAIIDPKTKKFLLQDHLLAQIWVPAGGHIDPDEDPAETVRRECQEELGIDAHFMNANEKPLFVTVTTTNGQGAHTDVSLWYVLEASETSKLTVEPGKFADVKWWDIDEILETPVAAFDPHLHRFVTKMQQTFSI